MPTGGGATVVGEPQRPNIRKDYRKRKVPPETLLANSIHKEDRPPGSQIREKPASNRRAMSSSRNP